MAPMSEVKLGLYGVPTSREDSRVILIPVPWDVTTSYGGGTSQGPQAIFDASVQVDLYDSELGEAYRAGYHMDTIPASLLDDNLRLRNLAKVVIDQWSDHGELNDQGKKFLAEVNAGTQKMVDWVQSQSQEILSQGKIPAVLGGDHSTPLGLIAALGRTYQGDFGVLHVDAHADLRQAYHGFQHSHASIMRNVLGLEMGPRKLVQVGIRDFCKEELDVIEADPMRIRTFFDRELKDMEFSGQTWKSVCTTIVNELPKNVYVSFDVDGLSPDLCPGTGTPVPGGLSFGQATFLLRTLGQSGRRVIGFDLNEVAPSEGSEWDANVGARLLFKLCGWAAQS
jgi:agmatinase